MLTYDDILYIKCLLYIYILPEDGFSRPKHVGEIIMTKQIYMHEYLRLVVKNTAQLIYLTVQVHH